MSDGRPFTDYRPRCAINADLMTDLDKNNMIDLKVESLRKRNRDEQDSKNIELELILKDYLVKNLD